MFNFFRRRKVINFGRAKSIKMAQSPKLISSDAAMVYLGMDEMALRRKVSTGELRAFRSGNGMVFRLDDLEAHNLRNEERMVIDG